MKYHRVVDTSLLQFGDVLCVTSGATVSELIRVGEQVENRESLHTIIDAIHSKAVPSHTIFVVDPIQMTGHEMNPPHTRSCSLKTYITGGSTIVSCLRNPWLSEKHNPESYDVTRNRLWKFIRDFEGGYGYYNLFDFLLRLPQDKKHLVCSQYTLLGWIVSTMCEGYDCRFPEGWVVAAEDNKPWPGMVSPLDLHQGCNKLGWCVPFYKIEEK
jgi:hypothetical protein